MTQSKARARPAPKLDRNTMARLGQQMRMTYDEQRQDDPLPPVLQSLMDEMKIRHG